MYFDEPADRPCQDPYASLPVGQWEDRFRERITFYQKLVLAFPDRPYFANTLANYQRWFHEHLLRRPAGAIDDDLPF